MVYIWWWSRRKLGKGESRHHIYAQGCMMGGVCYSAAGRKESACAATNNTGQSALASVSSAHIGILVWILLHISFSGFFWRRAARTSYLYRAGPNDADKNCWWCRRLERRKEGLQMLMAAVWLLTSQHASKINAALGTNAQTAQLFPCLLIISNTYQPLSSHILICSHSATWTMLAWTTSQVTTPLHCNKQAQYL
jgi:hypothetical protein